jgi:orotate phosphoribosyltransferase
MLAKLLKECGAIKFGEFLLSSGKKSNYYVDIKKASTNPFVLKEIAREMSPLIEGYDFIAGMELGAVPIAVAASLETGIPYLIVRKEKKGYGTGKQIEGDLKENGKAIVVEDVATTGKSILTTVDILRENAVVVEKAIVVVDREEGAFELLKKNGVKMISLVTIDDLMK